MNFFTALIFSILLLQGCKTLPKEPVLQDSFYNLSYGAAKPDSITFTCDDGSRLSGCYVEAETATLFGITFSKVQYIFKNMLGKESLKMITLSSLPSDTLGFDSVKTVLEREFGPGICKSKIHCVWNHKTMQSVALYSMHGRATLILEKK